MWLAVFEFICVCADPIATWRRFTELLWKHYILIKCQKQILKLKFKTDLISSKVLSELVSSNGW